MASSRMLSARSVRCLVRYPISVPLSSWSPVTMVASWPSPRSCIYALAGSPASSTGASKPHFLARLGLAPSAPSGCLCGITSLPLPAAVPCCGLVSAAGPGPLVIYLLLPLYPLALVSWVMGGVPSPTCPCPYSPRTLSPLGVTTEVSSPRGNYSTPGASMPLGNSTSPPTTWRSPLGFSATPEALRPPSLPPTPEDSLAGFSHWPATLSLFPGFYPWYPPAPALSTAMEVTTQVSPPTAP